MSQPVVTELFSLLQLFEVKHVVCSPGSRNASLLQEADRNNDLKKLVVIDERTAAFVALGIALVSRAPVALICTSGSALLNYAPAVAEAYYQGIPLIIISADRPYEWIDQDDSQTIRQFGVLSNIVKKSYDLNAENTQKDYIWFANRIINEGLLCAIKEKRGPVHFNIHLSGIVDSSYHEIYEARKVNVALPPQRLANEYIEVLAQRAANKKIMVIAGFMLPDNKLQKAFLEIAKLPNVCIMAETLSNLHLNKECYMVDAVLFPLEKSPCADLTPDIVISLGGALVSRKLKEFIRNNPPKEHWSLNYSDNLIDCFQSLTLKLECSPASFIRSFAKRLGKKLSLAENNASYRAKWDHLRNRLERDFTNLPWCDLKALQVVLNALPEETNLFLSNGTSVRYGQIIPYRLTHATFSNRGVSGIEGVSSTAVGAALVYDKLTCLISGDMSFTYDIGALACELAPANLRIIVTDNGGGDIFRFIKATKNLSIREKYLSVGRDVPVSLIADSFGWIYYYADNIDVLEDTLSEFFSPSLQPKILHIVTGNGDVNSRILSNYLKFS